MILDVLNYIIKLVIGQVIVLLKDMGGKRFKTCAVYGCTSQEKITPEMKFFHFPRTIDICRKWVEFCQNDNLHGLIGREFQRYFICTLHFEAKDFTTEYRTKLNRRALPSLGAPLPRNLRPVDNDKPIQIPLHKSPISPEPSTSSNIESSITSSPVHSQCDTPPRFSSHSLISLDTDTLHLPHDLLSNHHYKTTSVFELNDSSIEDGGTEPPFSVPECYSFFGSKTTTSQLTTPYKRFLLQFERKKISELKKLKKKYKGNTKRLHNICKLEKEDFLSKHMSTTAATFLESQLHFSGRKPTRKRWPIEDKVMALSIYKRSPKTYMVLRKIFTLPRKQTLISMASAVPFRAGINSHIFTTLSQLTSEMQDFDRMCSVMFDEISLGENLHYNPKFDFIEGFEDYGNLGRTNKVAKYAQVFMLRGLLQKWKQPAAYYFSHNEMKAETLKQLLLKVLHACKEAGFCVIATICDMSVRNVKTIELLGSTRKRPFFRFLDEDIITLYDPPSLLKCLRNTLLNHDMWCEVKTDNMKYKVTASWNHVQDVYNMDRLSTGFCCLYKLTPSHLHPDARNKLKIKLAAQVMSYSVSATIMKDASFGLLPVDAVGTATFIKLCDQLFDSFNGYAEDAEDGKPLRSRLTSGSQHWDFWNYASKEVNKWQFLVSTTNPDDLPKIRRMPCQDGWLVNINGVKELWSRLSSAKHGHKPIQYLIPRNLNKDPMENLFGSIRSHSGSSKHLTVCQFVEGLKTSVFNGLAFRDIMECTNCLNDDTSLLCNLQAFISEDGHSSKEMLGSGVKVCEESVGDNDFIVDIAEEASLPPDMTALSTAYVSGFIAKSILLDSDCDGCIDALCCASSNIYFLAGVLYREHSAEHQSTTYPSEHLVKAVVEGANLIDTILDKAAHMNGVKATITSAINEKLDFTWLQDNCDVHSLYLQDKLVQALCNICIPWWCQRFNRDTIFHKKR